MGEVYRALTRDNSKDWLYRRYYFYLLFGQSTNADYPWDNKFWTDQLEQIIDKILAKSTEYKNTGIRVLKYEKQADSKYKEVKHGRLRWDRESHEKWTIQHQSEIDFREFELWTPIWTRCEKADSPPDIFISINNERDIRNVSTRQFDSFVVLAVATDMNIDCKYEIIELSKKLNSRKTVCHIRKWSKGKRDKDKNWKFPNWIQDTFSNGIYRGKSLHKFDFKDIVFDEQYWEIIYP